MYFQSTLYTLVHRLFSLPNSNIALGALCACMLLLYASFPMTDTFAAHPGVVSGCFTGKTTEQAQVLTQGCNTV